MSREIERRRRAIVTGLTPYMDNTLLLEAVNHWQANYSQRPRFSLQGFVSDLCSRFEIGERRHQIHMSLVQAMTLSESQLASDPLSNSLPDDPGHPVTEAFQSLLQCILDTMDPPTANQFRLTLSARLRNNPMSPETRFALEHWLQQPARKLEGLPLATLKQQLNSAYILLCEQFGPVDADRLLRDAYQACSQRRHTATALQSLM